LNRHASKRGGERRYLFCWGGCFGVEASPPSAPKLEKSIGVDAGRLAVVFETLFPT
jgi:hypothetical protein